MRGIVKLVKSSKSIVFVGDKIVKFVNNKLEIVKFEESDRMGGDIFMLCVYDKHENEYFPLSLKDWNLDMMEKEYEFDVYADVACLIPGDEKNYTKEDIKNFAIKFAASFSGVEIGEPMMAYFDKWFELKLYERN